MSDEIFCAGTNFVIGCERPVTIDKAERERIGLGNVESLEGPWVHQIDARLRRFTYEKYFGHNEQQVNNEYTI